jgi:hypothetical protein
VKPNPCGQISGSDLVVEVAEPIQQQLLCEAAAYKSAMANHSFLPIEFETLQEYLTKLEGCATALGALRERLCVYLAAAVSDFFIPTEKVRCGRCLHYFFTRLPRRSVCIPGSDLPVFYCGY